MWRVSSAAMRSTDFKVCKARNVISSRFPMGVPTIYRVPICRCVIERYRYLGSPLEIFGGQVKQAQITTYSPWLKLLYCDCLHCARVGHILVNSSTGAKSHDLNRNPYNSNCCCI
ncbi:conserved protein of unknown function [Limnospira indica PCC 8005]|uniref:Uncharacterized protein n=1 Tax=Limnospira indica PCC 8005 TaxID=376219 RepID=A0A9P1KDN1_9CYAN|nr:conserved protein of unknown function [Limnospira indica PCC 8005]